tara:strand:- start:74 stop:280 length:207 start_codon:yes stop_codon:yes gene_type:complete
MPGRKAKKNINTADDFLVFTREGDNLKVEYKDQSSFDILLELANANEGFLELVKQIIRHLEKADPPPD